METWYLPLLTVILLLLFKFSVSELTNVETAADGSSGTIKFQTPDLSDEEQHSLHMPAYLRCEACEAVAYQLAKHFNKRNDLKPSFKGHLPESEILDVIETVCNEQDTFKDYGIKEVEGETRLSGPGTKTNEFPGVMQGGGRWPARLNQICNEFVGAIGEEEIYDAFIQDSRKFTQFLCNQKGGACSKESKQKKKNRKRRPLMKKSF